MFYTADSLRRMHQGGEPVDFLFFYGHQLPSDGSTTESCLSQWYPCIFEAEGILYQSMAVILRQTSRGNSPRLMVMGLMKALYLALGRTNTPEVFKLCSGGEQFPACSDPHSMYEEI